jgi:hypothetical protein
MSDHELIVFRCDTCRCEVKLSDAQRYVFESRLRQLLSENAVLRDERDEARRDVCEFLVERDRNQSGYNPRTRHDYAEQMDWDCFDTPNKENMQ